MNHALLLAALLLAPGAERSVLVRPQSTPPPAGIVQRCRIVEVYDGDTVTVEVTTAIKVRLLDCWADEVRTTDADAKARGLASRDHLARLCGSPGYVAIPFTGRGLGAIFSFDRALGRVWLTPGGPVELSAAQVAAWSGTGIAGWATGHATEERPDAR